MGDKMDNDLQYCVNWLTQETHGTHDKSALSKTTSNTKQESNDALFERYRALVNVREPLPASEDFLAAQDRMLQARIAERGITRASELPRVKNDPRISLWRGDITTLEVDAIVNAANSQLLGCWIPGHYCIDNAIHTFAGIQLRAECARIMQEQGFPEPSGMAKATSAFNLPATYVIHTVGPIANGAPSDVDRTLLANCYTSCLDVASGLRCKSIAFCCISTGVFGFPQDQAAKIAVGSTAAWLDAHNSEMHVVFNVFGEKDERLYHELLCE